MGIGVSIILRKQKTYPMPFKAGFPINPKTIGEHIKRKRMQLGLMQSEVAEIINVSTDCIYHWETNRNKPQINYYQKIISFLEYNPFEINANTLSEKIFAFRCLNGLSSKAFGRLLKVDASTVRSWELGESVPNRTTMIVLISTLGL